MQNAVSQRDQTIDFLKGIAIYLVVLGHINVARPVENVIYSFHMSLFMSLSGCVFFHSFNGNAGGVHLEAVL